MRIYIEAESNANLFALACFGMFHPEEPGDLGLRIRRAEHACKPYGLQGRGVNRISARQGKYRRSREWRGMARKEGTGARSVPGGGEVFQIRGKLVHFPRKDGRRMPAEWP